MAANTASSSEAWSAASSFDAQSQSAPENSVASWCTSPPIADGHESSFVSCRIASSRAQNPSTHIRPRPRRR
jgi:hypothetical protein